MPLAGCYAVAQVFSLIALLVAVLVSIAGLVALAQALGAHTYWPLPPSWPGRMTGTTGNPINLAGFGLLGLWLALLAGGDGGFAAGLSRRYRVAARGMAAVGAACGLLAIVLAVTRAAYLGVAVALVGAIVLLARRRRTRALIVLGAVLAVLLAGAFVRLAGGSSSGSLAGRLGATHTHTGALDSSDRVRLKLWKEAVDGIGDRPLLGYGAGAFVVADRLHRPQDLRVSEPWKVASDPHSVPLLVGSTTGVPGLLLVGGIVALIGASVGRRVWRTAPPDRSAGPAPRARPECRAPRARPTSGLRPPRSLTWGLLASSCWSVPSMLRRLCLWRSSPAPHWDDRSPARA